MWRIWLAGWIIWSGLPRNTAAIISMSTNREEIIQFVGRDNEEAKQFCRAFVNWCHWIDDVLDKDVLWLPQEVVRVNLEMVLVFSENAFFQSYKHQLMPLVLQASRAFGDSLNWAKRES